MEEIKAAAKAAKVDYFIRTMPQGYNTVLDNDAANLSVGQRQLINIARVFLCKMCIRDRHEGEPVGIGKHEELLTNSPILSLIHI